MDRTVSLIEQRAFCASGALLLNAYFHDHGREKEVSKFQPNTTLSQQEACHTAQPSETLVDLRHKMREPPTMSLQ